MRVTRASIEVLTGALILLATPAVGVFAATTGTIFVASNGVDSPSCGPEVRPCRSITQALANVPSGGFIMVGPGHYGDVNGDGRFDGPGDERPHKRDFTPIPSGPPTPLSCLVCILKPV